MPTKIVREAAPLALLAILFQVSTHAQSPSDPLASARALADQGKLPEAEAALRTSITANPNSADAHFLLGFVLFGEKKARESLAEFTAGAKFRRPGPEELKTVASDYVLLNDLVDADKWFSAVVAELPNDANVHYLLGRTRFNENDYHGAIASFERALALHPKYVEAENNLGLAWRELNETDKARAAFETAIEWQGPAPIDAQPFLNLGKLYGDQHQPAKAIDYLQRAAALAPNNPTVHEELSHAFAAQADLPQAQAELEKAIALAPNVSSLHYQLGQLYRKQGLVAQAKKEFDLTARLSGSHSSDKTPNPLSIRNPNEP
ncbi:tetratricopeptide repeat protein [Occallatibacter savannae]|uniref:tetratricopeptide repeat protein n=1 Tax=Occallatibacter savannae TaxID=1002691 RepID=UPI0013A572D1|nr:tetratricopeptide repeat protein [Occallatibacter savannae]